MESVASRHVVMTICCSRCQAQQVVHVRATTGCKQISDQTVVCISCHRPFDVLLPDDIVGGPFPK